MKNSGIVALFLIFAITIVFIFKDEIFIKSERTLSELELARELRAQRDSIAEIRRIEREANRTYWYKGTFTDEFGDPTGKKYINTTTEGGFSNSATRNSYLFVEILVTKNSAGIFLHEYEKNSSPESFYTGATVMLKNSSGETLRISSNSKWNQTGGLAIRRNEYSPGFLNFKNFLLNSPGNEIKVVIQDEYSSRYNFTINTKGFKEEFEKL